MRGMGAVGLVEGRGIVGDRYMIGTEQGFHSDKPEGRQITLFEEEAPECVRREHNIAMLLEERRRNVTNGGVPLNHPVGRRTYCCGPAGMIADFEAATADWPAGTAHVAHFVPPPLAPDPEASPFTLVLARSGREAALPAIRALGAKVEASCEGGICGACRVRWLQGPPLRRGRVLRPEERGRDVMARIAGCAGPRLVLGP